MRTSSWFAAILVSFAVLVVDFSSARRAMADEALLPEALQKVQRCLTQARPIVQSIQATQAALTEEQIDAIGVIGLLKDSESAHHLVRGIDLQRVKIGDARLFRPGQRSPQWLSAAYPAASALAEVGPRGASAVIKAAAEDEAPTETRLKLYAEVVVRCLEEDLEIAAIFVARQRKNFALEPAKQARLGKLMREIEEVQSPGFISPKMFQKMLELEKAQIKDKSQSPVK